MHDETKTRPGVSRLAGLLPASLALLVIWYHYRIPGVSADGVTYLQIARNILMGKGLGWQALWVPPLHSILIAGASLLAGLPDLLNAAGLVSPLMFFGLVMAVYYLALELFDLRSALVAAFFTALFPHLHFIAFSAEAEITYTFLLTLALLFFARSVLRSSRAYAIAAGVTFSLAWMARSEGFLIMAFVFACATALQGRAFHRSKVFRYCLLGTLFFMLVSAPYLLFLHKHYGSWVISPKSSYVLIWMKSRIYHDNDKGEMGNDELWGLTPDGAKLRWQEPKGLTDLAQYLMSHPRHSISVYLHNLGLELPGRIPNNSGMERYPQPYPVYLVLSAMLALFLPWGAFPREKRVILLAPLLILLVLPLFTEGWWKYMIPYLPVVILMAAKGFSGGTAMVAERLSPRRAALWGGGLLSVVAIVIGGRFLFALHPFSLRAPAAAAAPSADISTRILLAEEARKAGQWGVQQFGPGKNYMASWSKIIYYLEGQWTALPVADLPELLRYARRNEVDYIVVETAGAASAATIAAPEGTELAGVYRSSVSPYAAVFFRLLPR